MTREPIRSIQTGLNALGYSPGALDGQFGAKTRAAAENWLAAGGKAAPVAARAAPVAVDDSDTVRTRRRVTGWKGLLHTKLIPVRQCQKPRGVANTAREMVPLP